MMADERRTIGGARVLRRALRAAPARVLAAFGAVTGQTARADREIAAVTTGCLFEHVSEVMSCDAAIVPGAYVFPDGTPSDMLADRLAAALALVRAGTVLRVIASGGPQEVAGMVAWLEQRGVADVVADPAGVRTWETMRGAAQLGVQRVVICTQRFHLPRALYLGRAAGLDAVGLVADARGYRGASHNASREACARMRALLDVRWSSRRKHF
jgi:SanA protein